MEEKDRAIFVLKSDLITTKTGRRYPISINDWKLVSEVVDILRKFAREDYMVIILDNGDKVMDGLVSIALYNKQINDICIILQKALKENKFQRDDKYRVNFDICNKRGSYKYMPNAGMVFENVLEYELEYSESILLTDSDLSKILAVNARINTINL